MNEFTRMLLNVSARSPLLAWLLDEVVQLLFRLAFSLFGGPIPSEACWPETVLVDDA